MAVRTSFTSGEVLAAADLTDTFNSKPKKTTASSAPGSPATGDLWFDTTTSPAIAKFWSGSAWQTFSAGAANFSNSATGTYTDGGVNYKYITFTGSGSLTVTKAGFATVLCVGGGGGAYTAAGAAGGGGVTQADIFIPVATHTVTIGAGGSINTVRATGNFSFLGANRNTALLAANGGVNNWNSILGATSGNGYTVTSGAGGAGAGGDSASGTGGVGLASTITNTSVTYGAGGTVSATPVSKGANTGDGGDASGTSATAGGSGVVIIRVKV